MAADLPENYERFPDARQFIKDVAVDWDDTRVLSAEPGDFITIARKAKRSDEWFIGLITDEEERTAVVVLDYLDSGKIYVAALNRDAQDAHWERNPMAYRVDTWSHRAVRYSSAWPRRRGRRERLPRQRT